MPVAYGTDPYKKKLKKTELRKRLIRRRALLNRPVVKYALRLARQRGIDSMNVQVEAALMRANGHYRKVRELRVELRAAAATAAQDKQNALTNLRQKDKEIRELKARLGAKEVEAKLYSDRWMNVYEKASQSTRTWMARVCRTPPRGVSERRGPMGSQ